VHADHGPVGHPGVESDAVSVGHRELSPHLGDREPVQCAASGTPVRGRVLGVEPGLDGVPPRPGRFPDERSPFGDAQLQCHKIESGDAFGDRMLHLESGVHLQEEELAVGGDEELDGSRADVVDRARHRAGGLAQPLAQSGVHGRDGASSTTFWCRRWIEHSRSPSAQTVPWESANTWISTCRPRSR
jgi:hypothetical protein